MTLSNAVKSADTAPSFADAMTEAWIEASALATRINEHRAAKLAARVLGLAALAVLGLLLAEPSSAAGTAGFDRLYETLDTWISGSLGKSIAIGFLIVGLASGLLRGNLAAAVVSLGCALALAVGPEIIDSVFSAGS